MLSMLMSLEAAICPAVGGWMHELNWTSALSMMIIHCKLSQDKTKTVALYDMPSCLIIPIHGRKPPDPAVGMQPGRRREGPKTKASNENPKSHIHALPNNGIDMYLHPHNVTVRHAA
jgi:hypothetical protein